MDDGTDHSNRGVTGRFWRGELGLSWLLWKPLAGTAVAVLACAGLAAAAGLLPPKPAFFLELAAWAGALAAAAWLCMGLFRAGLAHGRRGGSPAAGYMVAAVAALAVITVAGIGTRLAKVDVGQALRRVQADLPITTAIRVVDGGTGLVFDGDIEHGAAKALREAAALNPRVTLIHLGGMGGELREARWMRDFIAGKRWNTHTSTLCWSGCAIAYLGGARRTMSPEARMGFHSASVWPFGGEAEEARINAGIAREMIERGVDPAFARRAWRKDPAGMWFPSHDELIRAGLVHAVTTP